MIFSDIPPYQGPLAELADKLWDIGAVKIESTADGGGFTLKLHETQPDAPKSPIFFNIRTPDNPKPGPLDEEALALIGAAMAQEVRDGNISGFDRIAPIPNAGDPLAVALHAALDDDRELLWLVKAEEGGKRKITGVKEGEWYNERDCVLLVDDLVTQAGTKLEAIDVLQDIAFQVVNDLLVLIDRQQGGREQVEAKGIKVTAVYELTVLLYYYVATGKITAEQADEVMAYISANQV
jgi:orotate phosphoribosyltransferase